MSEDNQNSTVPENPLVETDHPEHLAELGDESPVKSRKTFWRRALMILLLILLIGTGAFLLARPRLIQEINEPLGPTLPPLIGSGPEDGTPAEPTPLINRAEDDNGDQVAFSANRDAGELENQNKPLCNGPSEMHFLVVGADTDDPEFIEGLADVIRTVRVDFVTPSVHVLTIPRHLWVPISNADEYAPRLEGYFGFATDEEGNPIAQEGAWARLNVAWFYGNLYDLPGRGPGTMAQTLYDNFGIPIDHYVAVNMDIMPDVVDAIGGIIVDVPYDYLENYPQGENFMNGERALKYVRIRQVDSDWYRMERQNQVMLAMREKLLEPETIPQWPVLIDTFIDRAFTDLSPAQIAMLTCLAPQIDREQIYSHEITRNMTTTSITTRRSEVQLPHYDEIEEVVNAYLGK
jgi:LCP family protein required for cell wall assembly